MTTVVFKTFNSRDEWLEGRKDSIGASSLAEFVANNKLPQDLSTVHSQALDEALAFGSLWEKKVAQLFARKNGLALARKNTPVEELKPGELTWHDDSFYQASQPDKPTLHVSLDAAYRDKNGDLVTVEIKTGSATRYSFVSASMRHRYETQAMIEATITGAKKAIIVYCQRPSSWVSMRPLDIEAALEASMDIHDAGEPTNIDSLFDAAVQYKEVENPEAESLNVATTLLAQYVAARDNAEVLRDRLLEYLGKNPTLQPVAVGYKAVFKRPAANKVVNWKKVVEDNNIQFDEKKYMTVRKSNATVSITKARKK